MKKTISLIVITFIVLCSMMNSTDAREIRSVEISKSKHFQNAAPTDNCLAYFAAWGDAFNGWMNSPEGSPQQAVYYSLMLIYDYLLMTECDS
ncbi:MAG: hypothetical protein KF845_00285 [Cyclobacteriaceae bacterium]|nr:hypothetical protein [Cyclobacteriaceae bacterium]